MIPFSHYNIATEGIRANRKMMISIGFGYSISITIQPKPTDNSSGGGGHYTPQRRRLLDPLYSLIHIVFNKKEENFLFYGLNRLFDAKINVEMIKTITAPISILVKLEKQQNEIINIKRVK